MDFDGYYIFFSKRLITTFVVLSDVMVKKHNHFIHYTPYKQHSKATKRDFISISNPFMIAHLRLDLRFEVPRRAEARGIYGACLSRAVRVG